MRVGARLVRVEFARVVKNVQCGRTLPVEGVWRDG